MALYSYGRYGNEWQCVVQELKLGVVRQEHT